MAGARSEDFQVHYPVSELAARYGASAEEETSDLKQAYARFERSRRERPGRCAGCTRQDGDHDRDKRRKCNPAPLPNHGYAASTTR